MCFYYSINKKKPEELIKSGAISKVQAESINNKLLANGFEHPLLPVVTNSNPSELELLQWGLVPSTVKSENEALTFVKSYNTLNAKSETALESKIYSNPIISQRCLVLASGFFEWQHIKGQRIPYYITLTNESLFAFAGVWDKWIDANNKAYFTFSILTTEANELMSQIHNTKKRMPLILPHYRAKEWLQSEMPTTEISHYIKSLEHPELKAHTIKQFLPIPSNFNPTESILEHFNYELQKNPNQNNQLSLDF
jgi:putative SOS response-associated peptidase YedK